MGDEAAVAVAGLAVAVGHTMCTATHIGLCRQIVRGIMWRLVEIEVRLGAAHHRPPGINARLLHDRTVARSRPAR